MQVSKILSYNSINFLNRTRKPVKLAYPKTDTFEKRMFYTPVQEELFVPANSRIKENSKHQRVPFGVERRIMELDEDSINERWVDSEIDEVAQKSVKMAKKTEKIFDDKYGKDNYVIVSLGTSPIGIAYAMEFMGHDVRYVPISLLDELYEKGTDPSVIKAETNTNGLFRNYLDSIGLNANEIKKNKKHYIVVDYTYTGKSLEGAEALSKAILGINSKNVHFESINKNLENNITSKQDKKEVENYITKYMKDSGMARYCAMPHLDYWRLDDISKLLNTEKDGAAVGFEFALCHYLNDRLHAS